MTGPSTEDSGQEGDACVLGADEFRCIRSDHDHRLRMHGGRPALCPRCHRPIAHHCNSCGNCECDGR